MTITFLEHDSALGRWSHATWSPPTGHRLAGLVQSIWHFEGSTSSRRERTFPNGTLDLIVHLSDRYRVVEPAGSIVCPIVCVGELQTAPLVVESPAAASRVLGVRLHPVGAYALLGSPLSELRGASVDLEERCGRSTAELAERCHAARDAASAMRVAARWVSERVARTMDARRVDPAIAWAAAEIARGGGAVSIARLCARTGLSRGRIAAGFRAQVGVPPKLFARLHRFRTALAMLDAGARSLADVALTAGYYDQPHMNADFRRFCGLAPTEFLEARRYPASVSVAE